MPTPPADGGTTVLADGGASVPVDGGSVAVDGVVVRAAPIVLVPGGSAELVLAVERTPGFDDALAVVIEGLPEGVTASGPAGVDGDEATFVVDAAPTAASGEHPIVIRVSAGDVSDDVETYVAIPAAAGTRDASFAGASAPDADGIEDLRLLPDGRIVAVWSVPGTHPALAVARWRRDGALDPTLDGDGVVVVTIDATIDEGASDVSGVVVRDDGTAIALLDGWAGEGPHRAWLVATSPSGSPVSGFGEGGVFELPPGETVDLALGADRLFVLQGELVGGSYAARVRSYDATTPGSTGIDATIASIMPSALEVDGTGRALVLGRAGTVGALARLATDGAPDESFHADGVATFGALDVTYARSLGLRDDGTILVVGGAEGSGTTHPFAALLDDHGELVPSFGALGGRMVVEGSIGSLVHATVAPDGAMLATGYDALGAMTLVRILPGGVLAPEMGPMGVRTDDEARFGRRIAAMPDRRVVVTATISGSHAPMRFWY